MSPFVKSGGGMARPILLAVVDGVTNFPAATLGQEFLIATDGPVRLGGTTEPACYVGKGDLLRCVADTASGTYAAKGGNWNIRRAMVNMPDGHRCIEMAINTTAPTRPCCFYFMPDGFYYNDISGVSHKISPVS
jgi:hypothetical protein